VLCVALSLHGVVADGVADVSFDRAYHLVDVSVDLGRHALKCCDETERCSITGLVECYSQLRSFRWHYEVISTCTAAQQALSKPKHVQSNPPR
jgi:hypothetical protein